jgi:WS/DGAT/MGAT family acyltransferase
LPFNARLGPRRSFAFTTVPLAPLRDVRKRYDVKLNDVLLALVSAAVRRVLLAEGKLPEESVVALCPVSLRTEDDAQFGNQLTSMPVSLATDREDPIDRLLAIHRSTDAAKERVARGAFEMLTALGEVFVPGALRIVARAAHRLSDRLPLPANFVFSNVRAVPAPLYQAGARVEGLFPMSMLQVANGLNVTAVSHGDQVDFGFLTDARLIEDPWAFARGIGLALEELESASGAHLERERRAVASEQITDAVKSSAAEFAGARRPIEGGPPSEPAATQSVPSWADEEGEDDLLDLHLIMAGLGHLRTPSRAPIVPLEDEDD